MVYTFNVWSLKPQKIHACQMTLPYMSRTPADFQMHFVLRLHYFFPAHFQCDHGDLGQLQERCLYWLRYGSIWSAVWHRSGQPDFRAGLKGEIYYVLSMFGCEDYMRATCHVFCSGSGMFRQRGGVSAMAWSARRQIQQGGGSSSADLLSPMSSFWHLCLIVFTLGRGFRRIPGKSFVPNLSGWHVHNFEHGYFFCNHHHIYMSWK